MKLSLIFFRIIQYLRYWLLASDEHSLQSPFVFEAYTQALVKNNHIKEHRDIERIRRKYLMTNRAASAAGFGAGSNLPENKSNKLSQIARFGISSRRQSEILVNIIEWNNCSAVLELGTSLGINSSYLSRAKSVTRLVTLEGNMDLANEAQINFDELKLNNLKLVNTDIDHFFTYSKERFDLVYIDANHTYDATIRYFEKSRQFLNKEGVIVLDDINWSKDMNRAWSNLRIGIKDAVFIENDKIGIVFMDKHSSKQHYILRF